MLLQIAMRFCFGEFELDALQCRLNRGDEAVRLEKQPLDLLILLVERHGELVRREEIASMLWGSETFVDAEHGINTAIRKIRGALGDDPNDPRYVETVVRRGYRFKAAVSILGTSPPPPAVVATLPAQPPTAAGPFPLWILAAATVVLLASAGAIVWRGSSKAEVPILHWTPLTKEVHTFSRLASDGKHVFWTEYNDFGCHPYSVPVTGGEAIPVRINFRNGSVLDVSADSHMLINPRENCKDTVIQGPLWEVALDSGEARRVGDLFGQDAAYSPDGRKIAVAKGNELWLANRDGSSPERFAVLPSLIWTMHWSPDATRLRFALYEGKQSRFRLWEAQVDGQQARPILADWQDSSEKLGGVWISPTDFLFSAARQGSMDLWLMRTPLRAHWWQRSGPAIERVTAGPLDFEGPETIPGQKEVAVIGTHRQGELQRYDAAAGKFVPFVKGLSAEMADFSRDGRWMTYVSYPDGALWRSRADGSEPLQLTRAPWRAGLPRISPDGKRIVFTGELPGEPLRTYLIPFDGGTPKAATAAGKVSEVAPTWSPDGKSLLIRSDQHGQDNGSIFQDNVLQIVDLESRRITAVPDSLKKFNQRWSPDGKWIVATPNDEQEIDLFDLAANRWTVLASIHGDYPSWSADSKYLYFVHNDSSRSNRYLPDFAGD